LGSNQIEFLPLDKSWYIRLCILSLQTDDDSVIKFLNSKESCDDLKSTVNAVKNFHQQIIDVGESATLLRFLKFYCWKNNIDKKFIVGPMLKKRKVCNDKDIINLSLEKLLKLDCGTSQWASASILMGNNEDIKTDNEKILMSKRAVKFWNNREKIGIVIDKVIEKQAKYFLGYDSTFEYSSAEDYCFARAFNLITKDGGSRLWPQLINHESNRLNEMEEQIDKTYITSDDHRVIQALLLKAKLDNKIIKIKNRNAVNKSWPEFWKFYEQG
jgi:hypothetical protein